MDMKILPYGKNGFHEVEEGPFFCEIVCLEVRKKRKKLRKPFHAGFQEK